MAKVMQRVVHEVEKNVAVLKLQSVIRGREDRKLVKDSRFWEERKKLKDIKASQAGVAKAMLLIHRLMRTAIAKRRVKKAKQLRKEQLEKDGLVDDTSDAKFSIVFSTGSLGFSCRGASEGMIRKAISLKLIPPESLIENSKMGEVSKVTADSQAEKGTLAPGDLILFCGDKPLLKYKKLKERVEAVKKKKEDKVEISFLRGDRIREGNLTSLI